MLEGGYLFVMRYLPGVFNFFWGGGYGPGHFSGSGEDDHQLILLYGLMDLIPKPRLILVCFICQV